MLLWYFFDLDILSWPAARWQQGLFFATGLAVSDVGHWALDGFRVHH
ncbi:MAG: hypothetical protein JXA33_16900 [Anaerolineae bacterium]|nr:hypothetical protein [Anaerolineae bacterium]